MASRRAPKSFETGLRSAQPLLRTNGFVIEKKLLEPFAGNPADFLGHHRLDQRGQVGIQPLLEHRTQRIEDDILVTESGSRIIGDRKIPVTVEELEGLKSLF